MASNIWTKRIAEYQAGKPIPKSMVIAAASQVRRDGPHAQVIADAMTPPHEIAWAITPEQSAQGLKWCMGRQIFRQFTAHEQRILGTFSHFTFSGLDVVPRFAGFKDARPIYRVHSTTGAWFDYTLGNTGPEGRFVSGPVVLRHGGAR